MSAAIDIAASKRINRITRRKTGTTVKATLILLFYLLFAFSFTVVVGSVLFANNATDYSPVIPLALITLELTLLLLLYRLLGRYAGFVERHYPLIIASGLILLFAVNIRMGCLLRFDPVFDLGAVFTGAREWATTGSFMGQPDSTCDPNYFYYFPNNLGAMALLFLAFKGASLLGATDSFAVAMVTNALLEIAAVLLTVLICKRLFGVAQSVLVLVCVLLSPPFYLVAPVFYTDSLSMVFPAFIVYLYLNCRESATRPRRALFVALMGLTCALGMLVKFTVTIAFVAVVIYDALSRGRLPSLRLAVGAGTVIAVVLLLFHGYFYAVHLDRAKAEELRIPLTHWVMMSLENGYYNPEDYAFTQSFTDKAEQKVAIDNRIKERVAEKGASGMLRLFYWKGIVAFGDGTWAQSDFLDDNPGNTTALHALVLYDGRYYPQYKVLCSGSYFALQVLMLLSAYGVLLQRSRPNGNMLPLLCVFGVMLFLMFWEVSGRYVTNYIPMMIVSAISGLEVLASVLPMEGAAPQVPLVTVGSL